MIILLWIFSICLLTLCGVFLLQNLLNQASFRKQLTTLVSGIKHGLTASGFHVPKKNYRLELYKFQINEDNEHVCADCREKSGWKAMDIADWMKAGVPKSPGTFEACGGNCQCGLVLHETKLVPSKESEL